MIKRPARNNEDELLEMERNFYAQKAKDPNFQPSAKLIKGPRKSIFAKSRDSQKQSFISPEKLTNHEQNSTQGQSLFAKRRANKRISEPDLKETESRTNMSDDMKKVNTKSKVLLGEVYENILGQTNTEIPQNTDEFKIAVLGDVVEKKYNSPKKSRLVMDTHTPPFPCIPKLTFNASSKSGKSIFSQDVARNKQKFCSTPEEDIEMNAPVIQNDALLKKFGECSVVVDDEKAAKDVHMQNILFLSNMKEEEILAERKKLLDSMDPSLVELLKNKRKEKYEINKSSSTQSVNCEKMEVGENAPMLREKSIVEKLVASLPEENPAIQIVEQSLCENWIHFDVVEKDKLAWMHNIEIDMKNMKPGEKFEARFDWKGVLLPYIKEHDKDEKYIKDERELYLHGEEPYRPGYTLQELFRLGRSSIVQQRISAFGAIAGLLNIYNQGFYDQVLDLPISKIFFLLRFGLDDNTPAMLEVVSKAMSYLFYNETDETLLDFIFDNPGGYWQPTLHVLTSNLDEDPMSIENLQKQLEQLQVSSNKSKAFSTHINDSEEESKTSMTDFQLAETDLIECFLRTNILQRISFILNEIRPDNSTVSSCLKLLIRLARCGKEVAVKIVNQERLLKCLFENFLPSLETVDVSIKDCPFYKYPQYLCLKLFRVLAAQNSGVAHKLVKMNIIERLQSYLFNKEDIKNNLIKAQIEALRLLRCFLLLNVENGLYKKFLPAFRYMLEWHCNHVIFEVGGPYLLRQHASALLAAIASIPKYGSAEVNSLLSETIRDCCCNWFYKATRHGLKEFSQITLLSSCLNAVTWFAQHNDDEHFKTFLSKYLPDFIQSESFSNFIETISFSSIILKSSVDRRNVHPPLPNVGSIMITFNGPQLVIPQTYSFSFLISYWRLMELKVARGQRTLLNVFMSPDILEHLTRLLKELMTSCNHLLATNFYAKTELMFIVKMLCFEGFQEYFSKQQIFQIVYNILTCLTAEHIKEIEELFQRYFFNKNFIDADDMTLEKWKNNYLELVYPHAIIMRPTDMKLSMLFTQMPVLQRDWPYYQLRIILQNYLHNVQQTPAVIYSEKEVLRMTLCFVAQIERNTNIEITSPTEKLMYLMICFMGPDSQFLDPEMHNLLKEHLTYFYKKYEHHLFDLESFHEDKCRFENLYALFVDHFQAASYGDELFSSLVLLPMAQKYDKKWRSRVWSDLGGALHCLNCDENLLIGGIESYLQPLETTPSILESYYTSLKRKLVRPGTVPYRIAEYHVTNYFKQK